MPQIQEMNKSQSDLIVWYKLETEFFPDHVRHTNYVREAKNRNERVKESWRDCGELGKGGFGVVHRQIEKTTGRYRAVKRVDKRLPLKHDYSRELLVMAILAKHPSLFVEFLGWFEEPETLYIAMEYLGGGDLAKHVSTPLPQESVQNISKQILEGLKVMHQQGIAHRDLKPANIFVVSMSPVWVKLGDFGASKRVRAQATTTLHTQLCTRIYSAPEVLGLDSNSETSEYTNSVDIWSLGCVIYELLVGTKLFASEGQVSRYFFGKWPFPEDKLKGLSPTTDDAGILFLKSMLLIQPEDRPTAANALNDRWLAGLKSDNESGADQDEVTQSRDGGIRSRESRDDELRAHDRLKKRQGERNLINQGDTRYIPGDAGMAVEATPGPSRGRDPTTPKAIIDTPIMAPSDVASVESSAVQHWSRKSEFTLQNSQTPCPGGPEALGKKQVCDILTCPQSRTPSAKPNIHIKAIANQNWMLNLDPLQLISQPLTHNKDIVSNQAQRQVAQHNTRTLKCQSPMLHRYPRPTPPAEIVETKITQPSIYYKILTPDETLMLAGVLAGILMLGILKVAVILAGILMLARIPTLVRAFTRVLMPNRALISEEIETPGGTERQPRTGLELSNVRTLTRIPAPAGTLERPEISTSGGTEHRSGTELEPLLTERRHEERDTRDGSGGYIGNRRTRSLIEITRSRNVPNLDA